MLHFFTLNMLFSKTSLEMCQRWVVFLKKKWANPASFSFIFGLFQTNINTILQQINVKKCPSSIRHRDSNPRPSECKSPPITTRPGLQ